MFAATLERPDARSLQEIAASYGVGLNLLYDERKRGRLKISKIGKRSVVLREHEDAWRAALAAK